MENQTEQATEIVGRLGGALAGQKEKAELVEREFLNYPQVECPVVHHFMPGIYIREAHFQAGTMAVGHCHKHEHTNILLKGRIIVINGDGTRMEIAAPAVFAGTTGKKMAYIVEDTVWQNLHPTTETDLAKIEEQFIEKSEGWLEHQAALALGKIGG